MKYVLLLLITAASFGVAKAQKVDYKNNVITVDGKDIAKVNKIKDKGNFGITSTYELYSLSGKKLIIATIATDFEPDANDNMVYYYRFTFLTADQLAIFSLSKLGAEKSFAKLIGAADIMANDDIDPAKLKEFIASKSKNPKVIVDYSLVGRDRGWPLKLREDKTIEQNDKIIGRFRDVTTSQDFDSYEISLPNGIVLAKINFTGGNNAQSFELYTAKDRRSTVVHLPTKDKVFASSQTADRNDIALGRIMKWLVDKDYL